MLKVRTRIAGSIGFFSFGSLVLPIFHGMVQITGWLFVGITVLSTLLSQTITTVIGIRDTPYVSTYLGTSVLLYHHTYLRIGTQADYNLVTVGSRQMLHG